jgi:hypothetical protein
MSDVQNWSLILSRPAIKGLLIEGPLIEGPLVTSMRPSSRPCSLTRRRRSARGTSTLRRAPRLSRQRTMGRGTAPFPLQRALRSFGATSAGCRASRRAVSPRIGALRTLTGLFRRATLRRRLEIDAGPACLREPYRDGLLRGASAVLALTNVIHLLANELARLRARRLALKLVPPRSFHCPLLWHVSSPDSESAAR